MYELIILLLSGLGAGIVTGLIGLSAVNIVAPLLVIFLGYPIYIAIGLALGIDVFASISSSIIYWKKGKTSWKPAAIIVLFSLIGVFLGSHFGNFIPSDYLTILVGVGISFIGFDLFKKGLLKKETSSLHAHKFISKHKKLFVFLGSMIIGLIAGFFGGGGGLMILILLISIFNFKIHKAIGTSVLAMIFIAFFGSLFHYINIPFSISDLLTAGIVALFAGAITSTYANKLNEFSLKKISGLIILLLGLGMEIKALISIIY